ncbi:MAG: SAM-dependent methyltransferase [Tabrizicola sp.]|nr:SAM-dependent methyltransferase [Tabrizicola sp.]
MSGPPNLTDRSALLRYRARAISQADHAAALFLHETAVAEVQERLIAVNRTFTRPAIVTAFGDLWRASWPEARIVADAETLALQPARHDLVIHAMALHWANDPLGQMVQCRHALVPDGLFLGFCPGGRTLHELRSCLAEAEIAVTGGLSPRIVPMAEIRDLGGLLQRAGFALPVADSFVQTASYRSARHLMADLRAMGETNALAARLRHPTRRSVFAEMERRYADAHGGRDGRLPATFEILCLTGWAPHDSQQQPLRPGSAKQRLAEALNAREQPLVDPPRRVDPAG